MNTYSDNLLLHDLEIKSKFKILSSDILKWIAVVTMLLDHLGAVLVKQLYVNDFFLHDRFWYDMYYVLRGIGRTAFPLFAFLLVEGYVHTRSFGRYALRLGVFALLSEVPFNLANEDPIRLSARNVFFTLLLGLLMMKLLDLSLGRIRRKVHNPRFDKERNVLELLCIFVIVGVFGLFAAFIHCDYRYKGIILIAVFYLFYQHRILQAILGYLCFLWEPWSFPAFLCVPFYNGKRTRQGKWGKWFFYLFYPLHLLVIYGIRSFLLGQ